LAIITIAVNPFLPFLVLKGIKLSAIAAAIGKSTGNNVKVSNPISSNFENYNMTDVPEGL